MTQVAPNYSTVPELVQESNSRSSDPSGKPNQSVKRRSISTLAKNNISRFFASDTIRLSSTTVLKENNAARPTKIYRSWYLRMTATIVQPLNSQSISSSRIPSGASPMQPLVSANSRGPRELDFLRAVHGCSNVYQ
jgi:hypothetical protein